MPHAFSPILKIFLCFTVEQVIYTHMQFPKMWLSYYLIFTGEKILTFLPFVYIFPADAMG